MGEVAAVGQRQSHQLVPRSQEGVVGGGVGLRAGVGLHVGVLGPEQLARPVDGELLRDVHEFASAVVAPAGKALGVLVGEDAALAVEHGLGDEVLRGDHLQRALLAFELVAQHARDLGVDLGHRALEVIGIQVG